LPFTTKNWLDRPSELDPLVDETVKEWLDRITTYAATNPEAVTSLSAAALEDLETRLSGYTDSEIAAVQAVIATLAPLDSAALTGNPTAPTQASGNDSTRLATTAFVQDAVAGVGGGSAHVIEDEGTPLTQRSNLNFVGPAVAVSDSAGTDTTTVTISGGGSGVTPLSWTGLSFGSGCSAHPDFYAPGWAKDDYGIVHLRGQVVITGDYSTGDKLLGTLPTGARPATGKYCRFVVFFSDSAGALFTAYLDINPTGEIYLSSELSATGSDRSSSGGAVLDGINFPTS
jgi:hypothetical protein